MAIEQVDIALPEISYTGGSKELKSVKEIEVDSKDPKTPVKVMVRDRRPIGYTRGVPEFTAKLTVAQFKEPEVDWFGLMLSGEKFLITYEEGDGGHRYSLVDAIVNGVNKPFKEDGQIMFTVDLAFLNHRLEQ